jgi:hypothetical protein
VLIILLVFVLVSNLLVFPSVGGAQEAQQQNRQTGIAGLSEIRTARNNSHGVLNSLTTTTTAAVGMRVVFAAAGEVSHALMSINSRVCQRFICTELNYEDTFQRQWGIWDNFKS